MSITSHQHYCGPRTHLENGKCVPNKNSGGGSSSSSSSASATATVNVIGAEVSSCRLDGNAHGIQQKFNPVRYQACGLYTSADKEYYDGFVVGCMQVGNTKLICETVANSNIAAPPAQTQTAAQPTQAIQPGSCELMANIDLLGDYYASIRVPAIINHKLRIGRVFAEYKDKLVIIDGENKKEHEYLIPKTKVDRYGDNEVYFNLSEESLKEFEI